MKEIWRSVKEFTGLYEVSNRGRVRSVERRVRNRFGTRRVAMKILIPGYVGGYPSVSLWKNNRGHSRYVHRLIAEVFLDNSKGRNQVDHRNRRRSISTLKNIRWATGTLNNLNQTQKPRGNNPAMGVHYRPKCARRPFIVYINRIYVGSFPTLALAIAARKKAHRKELSKHALL